MSEAPDDITSEVDGPADTGPVDDAGQIQAHDDGPSAEDRAMAMGWTPKSQFKGDPEKWVDAETFVKRGEEFLPFLRANNRRLEQALDKANARMEQMDKGLKSAIQQLSKADQRAYAKAKADLEAELEQYAASGNVEAVKAINKDIVDLERETAKGAEVPAEDAQGNADFVAWKAENEWYGKDRALTGAFDALCSDAFNDGYTAPKAGLKEALTRLKAEFPHKFDNPNRRQPSAVEAGGQPPRKAGKTYADLPPDAKQMCDDLCRDLKGFTKEKYVKEFFS